MIHNRIQHFSTCCQRHNSHWFRTRLGSAFANASPGQCTTSAEHRARWPPGFCISPQNRLMWWINPVLEQICLAGCSKPCPGHRFSSLGWTAGYLLRDIKVLDLKNPGARNPVAKPNSRPNTIAVWNSIWTQCKCFLPPTAFEFLLCISISTSPNSPINLLPT